MTYFLMDNGNYLAGRQQPGQSYTEINLWAGPMPYQTCYSPLYCFAPRVGLWFWS